jgi:streptomycin 3"-adenylyltransferase
VRFPEPAASTLDQLAAELRQLLGANLQGLYVYGSLAFGCYNPARSDVDVLVLTRRRMAAETQRPVSELLRGFSTRIEITFVSRADLDPWRHPCPFDYHFSHSSEVHDGEGVDLASELTNARARGVALLGPAPEDALPPVPDEDYLDCLIRDTRWARKRIDKIPVYTVLNGCRALAFSRERVILSKVEGAEWALRELPAEFAALVERALTLYRSEPGEDEQFDSEEIRAFSDWVEANL